MTTIYVDINAIYDKLIIERLVYTLAFIQNHPCAPKDTFWTVDNSVKPDLIVKYSDQENKNTIPFITFCFSEYSVRYPNHFSFFGKNNMDLHGFKPNDSELSFLCPIDIFQTIFFHISRYEEWHEYKKNLDLHGMLKSEDHYLVSQGIHEIPVVDHLVYYLYDLLGLNPVRLTTTYCMTHDIDMIRKFPSFYKFIRSLANVFFYQNQKFSKIKKLLYCYFKIKAKIEKDPYDNFDWLLLNENSKIKDRKIYFLSGGINSKYEKFYKIDDPRCKPIFEQSIRKGYHLGIHPSYDSGNNGNMIKIEKEILEAETFMKIKHSRQHFLRYDIKNTGKILDEIGLSTDSSMGYRNKTGFRCGTGFPYHLYNFELEKPYNFIEIPLVVMDMGIIHQVGWDAELFKIHLEAFLLKNSHFTQITFNFHNSTFDPVFIDVVKLKSYYLKSFAESK